MDIKTIFEKNCQKIINTKFDNSTNNTKIKEHINNPVIKLLIEKNELKKNDIYEYATCRDVNNTIFICSNFDNLKFINSNSITKKFYKNIDFYKYFKSSEKSLDNINKRKEHYRDNKRRLEKIKDIIRDKNWLDFGCGYGGLLKISDNIPKNKIGLEIMDGAKKELIKSKFNIIDNINKIPNDSLDVITLSHVFAHLEDPIYYLNQFYKKLLKGGYLIIETPNSNDALYTVYNCKEFKEFISAEHLVIHNKKSLNFLLEYTNFKNILIENIQRYPLSNHLSWLAFRKPGQQISIFDTEDLNKQYVSVLKENNLTDTLFCICQK